jgi:hypothetical protein
VEQTWQALYAMFVERSKFGLNELLAHTDRPFIMDGVDDGKYFPAVLCAYKLPHLLAPVSLLAVGQKSVVE